MVSLQVGKHTDLGLSPNSKGVVHTQRRINTNPGMAITISRTGRETTFISMFCQSKSHQTSVFSRFKVECCNWGKIRPVESGRLIRIRD